MRTYIWIACSLGLCFDFDFHFQRRTVVDFVLIVAKGRVGVAVTVPEKKNRMNTVSGWSFILHFFFFRFFPSHFFQLEKRNHCANDSDDDGRGDVIVNICCIVTMMTIMLQISCATNIVWNDFHKLQSLVVERGKKIKMKTKWNL